MIKSRRAKGKADVTFTVDPQVGAQTAVVCGDWNDWSADAYQPNGFGADDSVVDLTALAQAVPPATKKAAARKTPEARKQATPKKVPAPRASSAKEAPERASAAKDEKAAPDQAAPPAKPARKKAK